MFYSILNLAIVAIAVWLIFWIFSLPDFKESFLSVSLIIFIFWLPFIIVQRWLSPSCEWICWSKASSCFTKCEEVWAKKFDYDSWAEDEYDRIRYEKQTEAAEEYYRELYCNIKWNIGFESWEKIYHIPWCSHYNDTEIDEDYWEKYRFNRNAYCTPDSKYNNVNSASNCIYRIHVSLQYTAFCCVYYSGNNWVCASDDDHDGKW